MLMTGKTIPKESFTGTMTEQFFMLQVSQFIAQYQDP